MSQHVSLSTEETYVLADLMNEIPDKRLNRRLLCISLRHFGYKIKEISIILEVSERTISGWIKLFLAGGFDELLELRYAGTRDSRLNAVRGALTAYLAENPQASVRDIQLWLAQEGVEISHSWLFRWLKLHKDELGG